MDRSPARSILLIEDNPGDAMLFKLGLEEARTPCRLDIAADGKEAIDFLLQATKSPSSADMRRPDLIVLDLNLPKISGHQVLQIIRADYRLRSIPVVILSCSSSRFDVQYAYTQGANSYLEKPKTLNELLELVRTIDQYWLNLTLMPS